MTAQPNSANAYLRTQILTAPPEELRLLLLDGAIRFCRQGRDGIAERNWEAAYNGFSKCRNILIELMTSMRPEIDPDLCNRLTGLYTFLYTRIMEASREKNVSKADEVIGLLEYERETWAMLIAKLREEKAKPGDDSPPTPAVAPATANTAPRPTYRPVSVHG